MKKNYNMTCPYCGQACTLSDEYVQPKRQHRQYFHSMCWEAELKKRKRRYEELKAEMEAAYD